MINQLAFFLSLILLCSCDNDDNTIVEQDNDLLHAWCLIEFRPGFGPTDNYSNCEIRWEFQSSDSVEVEVNTNVSSNLPLSNTGIYYYSYDPSNSKITIETIEYDVVLNSSSLEISDNPAADGPHLIFEKASD